MIWALGGLHGVSRRPLLAGSIGVAPSETWRKRGPGDSGSPSRTSELNPSGTAQDYAHLPGQLGLHGPHGSRFPTATVRG